MILNKIFHIPHGSAELTATPSLPVVHEELGVEINATPSQRRFGEDYTYTYYYGNRKQGDHIIDNRQDAQSWSTPQDVEVVFHCHAQIGQHITHAEIKVDQSSTEHEAHIIDGGIGQRFIRIKVMAKQTLFFKYEEQIYAE